MALVTLNGFVDVWVIVREGEQEKVVEELLEIEEEVARTQAFVKRFQLAGGRGGLMKLSARGEVRCFMLPTTDPCGS